LAASAGDSPSPEPESAVSFDGGKASTSVPRIDAIPRYDRNAPPPYPRLARERGWEGEVLLRVLVSEAGDVRSVSVERSSNHAVLDAAALRAVRRWRFHPSRLGETPVEGEVLVPLRFKLGVF
jgi:protein TonB